LSETDPFSDTAFLARLQKLLPMLGSAQPGEADAARRKLIEHLSHARLTLLDVAQRLQQPSRGTASFTQAARETSLERQLAIAREAREEAAQEARYASMRAQALEAELRQVMAEVGRMAQAEGRAHFWALAAWGVAAGCLLFLMSPMVLRSTPVRTSQHVVQQGPIAVEPRTSANGMLRAATGEYRGSAAVQDLEVRISPNNQAEIRAFLNRGEPLVVERRVSIGAQTWLLIRTETVTGWARSGDVLQP